MRFDQANVGMLSDSTLTREIACLLLVAVPYIVAGPLTYPNLSCLGDLGGYYQRLLG